MGREPLVIGPFAGGLNTYDDPTAVKDSELVECLNWDPGLEGSLRSRPPFQNLNKPLTLGTAGNPRFLGFFYGAGNTYHLIATDGLSSTWSYNGTAWSLITNTFAASSMAQFDNKAWLASPVGEADPGGYWTPAGGFVADAAMPHGDTIVSFKSRLWISPGRGNVNGTRVYYSKVLGQPSFWTSPNFVDVGQGDGQDIVLLTTYYNTLVAFRTQSIYAFSFNADPAQGSVTLLVPGVGLTSKDSLISYESYLYFMYDEKAYQFINNNAQQINLKVPFTATSQANISIPFGVSLFNNRAIFHYYDTMYVYSLRTKTWTRWKSPQHGSIGQIMSPAGVLTDEAYVNSSTIVAPPVVRRNLGDNTYPVNNGDVSDWGERWSFVRTFTGSECVFTCQSTQDSLSRGWDIKGNQDIAPGTSGDWISVPVTTGVPITISVEVKSNKALTFSINARIHDGATNWLAGQTASAQTTLVPNVYSRITYSLVPAFTGYMVFSVRANPGVTMVLGDTISGRLLIIEPGANGFNGYFDGGAAPVGSSPDYYTNYEGVSAQSPSRLTVYRKSPLLYIADAFTNATENYTCEMQTKNYNYQLSSNFKRLFWWGVDAVFRTRIRGWAVPVVHHAQVSWGQLYSEGVTWGTLLGGTWGSPFIGDLSVFSDYDLQGTGPMRKFVKMFKSLRFRQIYFKIVFDTDGSIGSAPINLFTLTAYVGSKETVSKTVS